MSNPRFYGRQTEWDYGKALRYGETVEGILYQWELAGPNGAHYHLWVAPNTKVDHIRKVLIPKFRSRFDVVSWSYDFLPNLGMPEA